MNSTQPTAESVGEPTLVLIDTRDPASAYYAQRTRQEPWSPFAPSIQSTRGGTARDYRLFRTIALELVLVAVFVGGLLQWRPGASSVSTAMAPQSMLLGNPRAAFTPPTASAAPAARPPSGIVLFRNADRTAFAPPPVPVPSTSHPYSD